jgi:hypothetical protein
MSSSKYRRTNNSAKTEKFCAGAHVQIGRGRPFCTDHAGRAVQVVLRFLGVHASMKHCVDFRWEITMKRNFFALMVAIALGFGIATGATIVTVPAALADGR